MTLLPIYLLELSAHDGTSVRTLRVASAGYITRPNDNPADTEYPAAIQNPGKISRNLFAEGRTLGQAEVGYGDIVVSNASGQFDSWIDYGFDGRPLVVKSVSNRRAAYSSAATMLRATMTRLESSQSYTSLSIRLYDRRLELDKPLQTNRYGGTVTGAGASADGSVDLKDRLKPLCFGKCENVPAVCVNPFNLIYQVNDGPVASIVVYDGGADLTSKGDFTTIANLIAATVRPGQYATCLALGLFRLGGSPAKVVTADVLEVAAAASRRAGSIAQRIMARLGLSGSSNINPTGFNAVDGVAPYEQGLFVVDDMKAIDAISKLFASVGAWIAPDTSGVFLAGRLAFGPPTVWNLTLPGIFADGGGLGLVANPDTEGGLPAYRVVLNHRPCWQTQDDASLATCVSASRRVFLAKATRQVKVDSSSALTKHPMAPEMTIDTLLVSPADAAAEAARRLALYSVRRDVLQFSARTDDAAPMVLGSTGLLTFPRLGYENGRSMIVIGREEDPGRNMVNLTVWG